ncbi:MAG: hypothetical protein QOE87_970 [Gaiellales bacterium]|jgi:hypothetical protein|nr:hypothetical protein [Gaiellales bacterium]
MTVDDYIEALPQPLREAAAEARDVIDAELGDGVIWHGHPVWMIGNAPVALLKAYTSFVTFGLFQGQLVEDPSGRLASGSRQMASVRLRAAAEVDEVLFAGWIREAQSQVTSAA